MFWKTCQKYFNVLLKAIAGIESLNFNKLPSKQIEQKSSIQNIHQHLFCINVYISN